MQMKDIGRLVMVVTVVLVFLAGCGSVGDKKAEYDGGYILASDNSYIALKEVKFYATQIANARMSWSAMFNLPDYPYVLEPTPSATLSSKKVKGFFVKGNYKFEHFSLHHLEKMQLAENERLFENKGPATKDKPFFIAGKPIEFKKKQTKDGYAFILESKLPKGKYVGWLGTSFWIFEVN